MGIKDEMIVVRTMIRALKAYMQHLEVTHIERRKGWKDGKTNKELNKNYGRSEFLKAK